MLHLAQRVCLRNSSIENCNVVEPVRLRLLSQQIYALGERPLFELLAEIVGGAPPMERIERYARLNRERGDFIRANSGDQFPPKFLIVKGND